VLDPAHVPPVVPDELLARFVLFSKHFRSSDHSMRPDAFIPHPHAELSMTRHRDAKGEELWHVGQQIAGSRGTLYGRADVKVVAFTDQGLRVVARPILGNTNHADAIDWPAEKPAQKIKALEIAAKSQFVPAPT
jgi:hypothetical protein